MPDSLIFSIYLVILVFVGYSVLRQAWILRSSRNGTRFTQWTFLVFNVAFFLFALGKLLDMKGVLLIYPEETRAVLMLIMAVIGLVFYSQSSK